MEKNFPQCTCLRLIRFWCYNIYLRERALFVKFINTFTNTLIKFYEFVNLKTISYQRFHGEIICVLLLDRSSCLNRYIFVSFLDLSIKEKRGTINCVKGRLHSQMLRKIVIQKEGEKMPKKRPFVKKALKIPTNIIFKLVDCALT